MKLTFLGTGTSQGVPMIACPCEVCHSSDPRDRRLRTSALVQIGSEGGSMNGTSGGGPGGSNPDTGNNESPGSNPAGPLNIVIDAGPDFRAQMLGAGVTRLDAILLTHEHKDHTGGIDDVRAYNYFGQTPLDIWATERVQESVRRDYWYAFEEHPYPGAPEIALHTIADGPFIVQSRAADGTAGTKSTKSATGVEIIPIRGCHMKLPVTGFRIGRLAYLTDFNRIDDAEVEKLLGVETLVVNALGHKEHISHFNLEQALELSRRVGARATWLTHIAHRMGLYADIDPTLPPGVHLAYDGLTIEI